MDIYASDDEKVESIKKWWKDNGNSVVFGIVIGLLGVFSWQAWQKKITLNGVEASGIYEALAQSVSANKKADVEKYYKTLQADYEKSTYTQLASLLVVKSKVDNGDLKGADTILTKVLSQTKDVSLQHIIRIRKLRIMLALAQYTEAGEMIRKLDNKGKFVALYEEIYGDIYWHKSNMTAAKKHYLNAVNAGNKGLNLQLKIDDLAGVESSI